MGPTGHPFRGVHLNRDDDGVVRQSRFICSRFDSPADARDAGYDALTAFYLPALDTVLAPLPAFSEPDPAYPPTTVYRFQRERIRDAYSAPAADSNVQLHPSVHRFASSLSD